MATRFNMAALVVMAVAALALLQSSAAQTTHVVGDSLGWTIPPGGSVAYTNWAAMKTFTVGDILVFNFTDGRHDVAEVTKEAFDACNSSNTISTKTNSPANFTLDKAGEHYYICTFSGHCGLGQKLRINVTAPGGPVTYTVGDTLGWNVPPNGSIAYQNWASNKSFKVGDILVFNFVNQTHNVAEVTKGAYDSCNTTTTLSLISNPPARITLTKSGEHFFTCTFPRHCGLGQKLAINVTSGTTATPPSSSATPPSSSATPPSSGATPPSSSATPPSSGATPPSSSATPPSSTATPPSTSTTPSTPTTPSGESPTGSATPPTPASSATSLGLSGFSATFLSIAIALFH